MNRLIPALCACACAAALACSGRKEAPTPAPEPAPQAASPADAAPAVVASSSAPIWRRAPATAVAGIVAGEGRFAGLLTSWELARRAAADDAFWAEVFGAGDALVRSAVADRRDAGPPDVLAVFFDRDGRRIDSVAASTQRQSPLAALGARLPEMRGDLELRIDPSRVHGFRSLVSRLDQQLISGSDAWGATLTVNGAEIVVDLHVKGTPVAPWSELLAEPSAVAGIAGRRHASTTALSLRIHRKTISAWADAAGVAPELIAPLSGDIGLFLREPVGAAPVAIELALGVADVAAARRSVGPLCNALLRPFGPILELAAGVCRVRIAAASEAAGGGLGRALLAAVAGREVVLEVAGDVLVVRLGPAAALSAPTPDTLATRRPSRLQWQLWLRSRSIDVLALVPGLSDAVDPAVARSLRWVAAHAENLEIGLRVGPNGVHGRVRLTATGRQPPSQR